MSFFSFIKRLIFNPKKKEIIWEGEPLSNAQYKKALKLYKRKIKVGCRISVLHSDFALTRTPMYINKVLQNISLNTRYEKQLLEMSKIDKKPREVLSFKVHLIDGEIIPIPSVIIGDYHRVDFSSGISIFKSAIEGTKLKKIKEVEITHTHPIYEVCIDETSTIYPLSEADIKSTLKFAKTLPKNISVVIKAVVPNGYFYWVRFK
jgi:hypothetical protein